MTLFQIENLKSGRRVRLSKTPNVKSIFEWGCDCGSDGTFLTDKELSYVERVMKIRYYNDGDCFLHRYEVKSLTEVTRVKSKPGKKDTGDADDLDFLMD